MKLIKATGDIALVVTGSKLAEVVHVEAMEAAKLTIPDTTLHGPDTVMLSCRIDAKPCGDGFPVTQGALVPLLLEGTVTKTGTYRGVLTVRSEGNSAPVRLTVTVTKSDTPFPLALIGADAVALADAGPAMIRVSMQEKSGVDQTLNRPAMILLSRRAPDGKGKAQVPSFTAVPWLTDKAEMGNEWQVPANGVATFFMRTDVDDAGEYTGTIRLTSPSTQAALNVPVTIWVRESGWLGALFISIGVLTSFGLRSYLGKGRTRLLQQREAMQLLADARTLQEDVRKTSAAPDRLETEVLDTLMQRIVALSDKLDTGGVDEDGTQLAELRARLRATREWVPQRRRIAGLLPEVRAKVAPELETVTDFLLGDSAAELEATRTTLRNLPKKIDAAVQEDFITRIATLREKSDESTFLTGQPLADMRNEVAQHLDRSSQAANGKRFDEAAAALLDAEAAYAVAVGRELQRRIEAETVPPFGFDGENWPDLQSRVREPLRNLTGDAAARIDAVRAAFRTYTEGRVAALETFARQRLQPRIEAEGEEPKKQKLRAAHQEALTALTNARRATQADDYDAAARELAEAVKKLREVDRDAPGNTAMAVGKDAVTPGSAPATPSFDLTDLVLNIFGGLGTRDPLQAEKRAAYLQALVRRLDTVVMLAVLGIAIVVGLQLLWAGNLLWGSFSDYLIAILWGLGLHEVTSSAVHGWAGVLGRMSQ
ncbi:MAG TPA: hypothetical protein VF432_09435 [Thermoanaerobaculia bacterium]